LANEVEKLTEVNRDLTILVAQKYSDLLKEKESIENDVYQTIAEENHAKEMDSISRSMIKLRVSDNLTGRLA